MRLFTGERVMPDVEHISFTFNRHLVVYEFAKHYSENKSVVDCGCGEGYGSNVLSRVATSVIGLDISGSTIEKAIKKYPQPNLSFQQANLERKIPLQSDSADVVICSQVIEHLRNPRVLLQEIHRVLKMGGLLIIATPNKNTFSPTGRELDPYHYIEYTQETFRALLNTVFPEVYSFHTTGNDKVLKKLQQDIDMAKRYVRYDIFKLHMWAPRAILKILYTIALNVTRRRMQKDNKHEDVRTSDFSIGNGKSDSMQVLDLLAVCKK